MPRINIKAIAIATVIMLVADAVAGVLLIFFLGNEKSIPLLTRSTPFLFGSIVFGTLSTILAGYVSARIARIHHYTNASTMGVLCMILGVTSAGGFPLWFNIVGFVSALPAAFFGGYWAKAKRNENT